MNHLHSKLEEVNKLHEQAMDLCELAWVTKAKKGKAEEIVALNRDAFKLEKQAGLLLATRFEEEPIRGIILQSAANLAYEIGEITEAERLINLGLAGQPTETILSSMLDLSLKIQLSKQKSETTSTAQIVRLLEKLPANLQSQTQDFIEFLARKHLGLDKLG